MCSELQLWVHSPCSVDAGREERIRCLEEELARREREAQRANEFYQGQVAEFERQIQNLQEDIARCVVVVGGGGTGGTLGGQH